MPTGGVGPLRVGPLRVRVRVRVRVGTLVGVRVGVVGARTAADENAPVDR